MRSAGIVLALLSVIAPGLDGARKQTRSEPAATRAVSGIVIDGVTGAPLESVVVTIDGGTLPQGYPSRQATDARGRFAFLNLADAESYVVTAAKLGYLDGGFGRDSAPSDALRLI